MLPSEDCLSLNARDSVPKKIVLLLPDGKNFWALQHFEYCSHLLKCPSSISVLSATDYQLNDLGRGYSTL
jgi:hypothetical protein